MHQVHLVGVTKGDVLGAERGRVAKLAVGHESAQSREIDGGVRSGFFLRGSAHNRYSLSHFWRVVKTDCLGEEPFRAGPLKPVPCATKARAGKTDLL